MSKSKTALESIVENRITTAPGHVRSPQETASVLSRDWASFVMRRMERDFSAMMAIGTSESPAQAVKTWGEAAAQAMQDYERQFARAADVMAGRKTDEA